MDTVRHWMTATPVTVPESMTLPAARRLMTERQIRRLLVVDAAGNLVGLVTEGDINRISDGPNGDVAEFNLYHRVADLPLGDFMRREVISVAPQTPLREAAWRMMAHHIRGVPVLEGRRVVGVLTVSDLLRFIVETAPPPGEAQAPA
jgi:CBS domain-containing protein